MSVKIATDAITLMLYGGVVAAGILALFIWIRNRTRKITAIRFFVQAAALFAIFATVLTLAKWNSLVYGVLILVVPIFFGRFFCGWLCPFGFYQDLASLVRKKLRIRYWNLPDLANRILHKFRYILAASMLATPVFFGILDWNVWVNFFQFQGGFKPLIIFFLGPLEPFLIPYPGGIGFSGYSLSYPYIRGFTQFFTVSIFTTITVIAFIVLTLAGSFMVRRFWCRFCPTGVSITLANRFAGFKWAPLLHINKTEEKCTKCGICKRVCPVQVTEVYEQKGGDITTSMCFNCMRCVEMCPYEGCLKVNFAHKTLVKSRNWLEPSKLNDEE
jgi:ferredoxin-type protein NapH